MKPSKESLYRTKWLIAHNFLHELLSEKNGKRFAKYLKQLNGAEKIASKPA